MKATVLLLALACAISVSSRRVPNQDSRADSCCKVVESALQEARNIKAGTTRVEIEKRFKPDGGENALQETRYLFRQCIDIKIKIEFELDPKGSDDQHPLGSPNDRVTYVHVPYLEEPFSD
jgi:hypothetical protein